MEQKNTTAFFLTLLAFSLIVFFLDRKGALTFFRGAIEGTTSPIQRGLHEISTPKLDESQSTIAEKLNLLEKLQKENEDLRMQLGSTNKLQLGTGQKLLLAHVLATGRFFIIDKGLDDGVQVGQSVVFKNIFIGKTIVVSQKVSRVLLPIEKDSILQVKTTESGAKGLVKGGGDSLLLSEVILSEKLGEGDIVETVGAVDEKGLGILPHLLIGTVSQIRKSGNQLFQEANIVPLIEYRNLQNVFIVF